MKSKFKATITLFLCIVMIMYIPCETNALCKMGSTGTQVKQVQRALKKRGYYNYKIDGIFGSRTRRAVRKFQKAKKLKVDGICGAKTLKKLGIKTSSKTKSSNTSNSAYNLLARTVAAEAGGESYKGQVAVAAVILNRVAASSFPDTVSGVIYQSGAFSCIDNGYFYSVKVTSTNYKAARQALNGWDPSGGALYYYNPKTADSDWLRKRTVISAIGRHVFTR